MAAKSLKKIEAQIALAKKKKELRYAKERGLVKARDLVEGLGDWMKTRTVSELTELAAYASAALTGALAYKHPQGALPGIIGIHLATHGGDTTNVAGVALLGLIGLQVLGGIPIPGTDYTLGDIKPPWEVNPDLGRPPWA